MSLKERRRWNGDIIRDDGLSRPFNKRAPNSKGTLQSRGSRPPDPIRRHGMKAQAMKVTQQRKNKLGAFTGRK